MSTTPVTVQTFFPKIEPSIPNDVQRHLQLIYFKLNNHALAFQHVASTVASGTKSVQQTILEILGTPGTPGGGGTLPTLGVVNDQSGNTTYVTQVADNAAFIILNDASPIAVTLSTAVPIPFVCSISNQGAGAATLTPQSGTISSNLATGAGSMTLPAGDGCVVAFDGTDFWANVNGPGSITGVTAGTGLTGGGTSGNVPVALATPVAIANGGTGTSTPSLVAGSNVTISGSWPDQTVAFTGGSSGPSSLLPNGYQTFGSGLILQWGSTFVDTNPTINFPLTFPNACLQTYAITFGNTDRITYVLQGTVTTSNMTVANNGSGAYANWLAIGW